MFISYTFDNLQISQLVPSYPGVQRHVYLLISSKHVASFSQGLLRHSLMSEKDQVCIFECTPFMLYFDYQNESS